MCRAALADASKTLYASEQDTLPFVNNETITVWLEQVDVRNVGYNPKHLDLRKLLIVACILLCVASFNQTIGVISSLVQT